MDVDKGLKDLSLNGKASANKVVLDARKGGIVDAIGITPETAQAASEYLTLNHRTHHIFFNAMGFHVGFAL
jgi:hypothetical protein